MYTQVSASTVIDYVVHRAVGGKGQVVPYSSLGMYCDFMLEKLEEAGLEYVLRFQDKAYWMEIDEEFNTVANTRSEAVAGCIAQVYQKRGKL